RCWMGIRVTRLGRRPCDCGDCERRARGSNWDGLAQRQGSGAYSGFRSASEKRPGRPAPAIAAWPRIGPPVGHWRGVTWARAAEVERRRRTRGVLLREVRRWRASAAGALALRLGRGLHVRRRAWEFAGELVE